MVHTKFQKSKQTQKSYRTLVDFFPLNQKVPIDIIYNTKVYAITCIELPNLSSGAASHSDQGTLGMQYENAHVHIRRCAFMGM